MFRSKTPAPAKHAPHVFEAAPEVPIVYPRSGTMLQETEVTDSPTTHRPESANCTLCGAVRDDKIHVKGQAEADDGSPKWG